MREMIAMLDGFLSPSQGANYGGGSDYPDDGGIPLLPSSVGLASVRMEVLSPSEGANYGGGSSWAPGLPFYPSSHGLAEASARFAEAERMNVLSPSEGANYSGGSDWTSGMPLYPSSVGLASGGEMSPFRTNIMLKFEDKQKANAMVRLYQAMEALRARAVRFGCPAPMDTSGTAPWNLIVSDIRSLTYAMRRWKLWISREAKALSIASRCSNLPPEVRQPALAAIALARKA